MVMCPERDAGSVALACLVARRTLQATVSPVSNPSSDTVIVERRGFVQVITINRPEAKNALNKAVAEGIAAAVDELDSSDELRVGVLTGAGGVFSAGMDLKAFLTGESPSIDGRGLCGITQTPPRKPLIGAVEGWALAGGFELLLACDLVVAGEGARFGVPEVKRSLVAAAGAAILLPGRMPFALALEMLLTGEPIDAPRAAQVGLVNRVVPVGSAVDVAVEIAGVIAENGPLAVAATKQVARGSRDWTFAEAWKQQGAIIGPVFTSDDAREGATAFAEKREPSWTGR
jgi:enoyl-CoA hydratase